MASVIFFTRPPKKTQTKRVSIYVRLKDGRKVDLTAKTGIEVLPDHFSNETHKIRQRASYKDREKDSKRLKNIEDWILAEYKDITKDPTTTWLRLIIDKFNRPDNYKKAPVTLFTFIQDFIDRAPKRILPSGHTASLRTRQDYTRTFEDLKAFADYENKKEYNFKDITRKFYDSFILYLTFEKGFAVNTIGKKIKVLKIFLNDASPEYISRDQFKDFKTLTEESDNIYLNEDELQELFELKFGKKTQHLEAVRDLFLIGCWTGLRFSDLKQVRPENINNGYINIQQEKTTSTVMIPVHPVVESILSKYEYKLPKLISNQKFNGYLKDIAKKAKFNKGVTKHITKAGKMETNFLMKWQQVTTHTARRSFATNAYKADIPAITIMAITGHKTESSFMKYIKITKEEQARKIKDIWLRSGSHLKVAK